ncbi:V-set and immunoglobulin domain-containing protein 10-like [Arapaima gigas]
MGVQVRRALRCALWGNVLVLLAGVVDCSLNINTYGSTVVNAIAGSNVILNVSFTGATSPVVEWAQNDVPVVTWTINSTIGPVISDQSNVLGIVSNGSLTFQNVQTKYSGNYTITIIQVGVQRKSATFTLTVFGYPVCTVQGADGNQNLQYGCQMTGGSPDVLLSFPQLSNDTSTNKNFSLTVAPSQNLDGKPITCLSSNVPFPLNCSITARGPAAFLPLATTTVDNSGNLVVSINCDSNSVPAANLTWSKDGQIVTSGGQYQISSNTSVLTIQNFSVSTNLGNYSASGKNPLGSQNTSIQLLGPTISNFSTVSNQAGTVVTLTWDNPRTSIITGFNIQMMGSNVTVSTNNSTRRKRATEDFRTIISKPASARSQDLLGLDPKSAYWFRVVPFAGKTSGAPSPALKVGPAAGGLSQAGLLGLAVGIPCAFLLLLIIALILFYVVCRRRRRQQPKYPATRSVGKVERSQPNNPHTLGTQGMKRRNQPPSYDFQAASERRNPLPSMLTPEQMRMATTV